MTDCRYHELTYVSVQTTNNTGSPVYNIRSARGILADRYIQPAINLLFKFAIFTLDIGAHNISGEGIYWYNALFIECIQH